MRLRRSEFWCVPLMTVVLCATAVPVYAQVIGQAVAAPVVVPVPGIAPSMPAGESPMVKSDPEMTDWLAKARLAIEKKEYAEAIKILQALIDKPDAGFVPADKKTRRFLPLRDVALQLLGTIPPEGLERYRRLYDPKAQQKLRDAVAAGDLQGIKTVAEQYRHTHAGPEAIDALGQWYFDHARFDQAGRTWLPLTASPDQTTAALATLKAAVAYHLAGDAAQATTLAKQLREKYPDAKATLAGREQNLVAALEAYRNIPPLVSAPTDILQDVYPGWGALPGGQAILPDSRVILQPYWRYPPADDASLDLQVHVGNVGDVKNVELENGNVFLRLRQGNSRVTLPIPAILRPVVADHLVIYRDNERVIAIDAQAGGINASRGWKSQLLPMERQLQKQPSRGSRRAVLFQPNNVQFSSRTLFDQGRYTLTVGAGRVYTLCHFTLSNVLLLPNPGMGGNTPEAPKSSSSLAALSLRGEGKLDWIVGWAAGAGTGGDPFLHKCTFLCPPAFVPSASRAEEGRLYVTALYDDAFYLLCLEAATGQLLWKSQIAQTPVVNGAMYNMPMTAWQNTPMSPPVVAEDRVFVNTNTGVTAAFDAQTGQPLWAYQYGAATQDPNMRRRRISPTNSTVAEMQGGVSPLLVCDGVLVSMPIDTGEVMGLSTTDGKLLWRRGRNRYLSFVDEHRICLAGRGVSILRARDGKELWQNGSIECLADPIATTTSLLFSGEGKLWRISRKDYAVSSEPLQPDGLLGNLISLDDKLIVANALGVCAYYDYDRTLAGLTAAIEKATEKEKLSLYQQRGDLSFSAKRYEQALQDYTSAESVSQTLPEGDKKQYLQAHLRQLRFRTCIALGNTEKDTDKALSWFQQASDIARTDQERAFMLIRIAKLLERGGRFAEAIDAAQTLYEQYPEEVVVDVRIGPDVNPRQTFRPDDKTQPARNWAYLFMQRLIEIHGQEVYAKYDAQAEQAMQQARRENTPEAYQAIYTRWRMSQAADDASFAGAEVYYTRACQAKTPAEVEENLRQCDFMLGQVDTKLGAKYRLSMMAAMAVIYTATDQPLLARRVRIALADAPGDTPISFADIHGPLEKVLADLDEGKITPSALTPKHSSTRELGKLQLPLHPVFSAESEGLSLLFDAQGLPLRLGPYLLVQEYRNTVLFDPTVSDAKDAIRGEAMTDVWNLSDQPLSAGISEDQKFVAVADLKHVSVFRTDTFKLVWKEEWANLGCSEVKGVGIGDDRIAVMEPDRLTVLDIETGKELWSYRSSVAASGQSAQQGWDIPQGQMGIVRNMRVVRPNQRASSGPGGVKPIASLRPDIADGWIVTPMYTGDGSYVVFDAQNGAKILSQVVVQSRLRRNVVQRLDEALLGDGRLAMFVDGYLRLYDLKESNKPILQKLIHAHRDTNATFLGWDQNWLAVRTTGERVLLYSLRNLMQEPMSLQLSLDGARTMIPCKTFFDTQRAYVFSSLGQTGGNLGRHLIPHAVQGFAATAFDPATGKQLWTCELAPARDVTALQSVTETQDHLVVTLWRIDDTSGVCLLVDKSTGKVAQRIPLPGPGQPSASAWVHPAVEADGRLIVETGKGITVYGH